VRQSEEEREQARIRVLIVDDHELVRKGFVAALEAHERFQVVAETGSANEALEALAHASPDIAVVDLRLTDMSGEALCRKLRERLPAVPVIILSAYGSEDTVRAAMTAGASAYVPKSAECSELIEVLTRVAQEDNAAAEPQIVEQLRGLLASRGTNAQPSPRQTRVLELAAEGLTYHQISERLHITHSTVRFHINNLKRRFGARTTTELVVKAIRAGAIPPPTEVDDQL
jgi:DNA-binding NarL/FixJ family response regulator